MLNRLILEDRDRKISDLRKTGEDVDIQVPKFFKQYRITAVILTLLRVKTWRHDSQHNDIQHYDT